MTLLVNILLRPIGRMIDHKPLDEDSDIETTYRFYATTKDSSEAHVRRCSFKRSQVNATRISRARRS